MSNLRTKQHKNTIAWSRLQRCGRLLVFLPTDKLGVLDKNMHGWTALCEGQIMYKQLCSFPNLLLAENKAAKHKRRKASTIEFLFRKEAILLTLQKELESKVWRPSGYRTFCIHDPKKRIISAAAFRDRVVHHTLCNIIEPVFERGFIFDSYANRVGKGTHRAIERFQKYARQYSFVLKCDIRKFFPSLDHEVLKQEIRRRVWCADTLWLIDSIIDGSNPQEAVPMHIFPGDNLLTHVERRRGLPIGNLTSQFWANVYLDRFDHFIKETLRVPGYIRYVDDFVLFSDRKEKLHEWQREIQNFLNGLRLVLHPDKTQIYRSVDGVPFLGFQVFPYHRYVRKEKARRYRRFLKKKIKQYHALQLSPDELENALNAWLGHIRFGQSERLEYQVFWQLKCAGIPVFKHPDGSWKILEHRPIQHN